MLKPLLVVLDVLLVTGAAFLGLQLHRIWTEPAPASAAPATASAPPEPRAASETARPPAPAATAYAVIAERNLLSPTRTEAAPEAPKPTMPTVASAVPVLPTEKPRLYGVVIGADGGGRAYLWDPQTKRVFGYKVGDSLADTRVEQIASDRVTLRRGADTYEVLLRDPSKPRPAQPPVAAVAQPGVPGAEAMPGMPPVPGQAVVPGQPPFRPPGAPQRPLPGMPGGRPVRPTQRGAMPVPPGSVPVPPQPPAAGDPDS
jgi:hypothetical protein